MKLDFESGAVFGSLTVVRQTKSKRYKSNVARMYVCQCSCGNETRATREHLASGHTTSCGCARIKHKIYELIGTKSGKLTIIDEIPKGELSNPKYRFIKAACDCGNKVTVRLDSFIRGSNKSCGCIDKRGDKSALFNGQGIISGSKWYSIRKAAKDRGLSLDIDISFALRLFNDQGGRCALSGVTISFFSSTSRFGTASLDRIDSSLGYSPGNVQWVHKDINLMKMDFDQNYFLKMCRLVSEFDGNLNKLLERESHCSVY